MELQLNQLSEEELVAASKNGDRAAYAALVRRHSRRVYAICLGVLGKTSEVEDMFQDTFVKGLTRLHTLRDDGQFTGWISQIARNLCRDHYRKSQRRHELLQRRHPVDAATAVNEYADLHAALQKLPERYRLPLVLFYFDGKSSERLAEELNLTKAGASSRLFRARNALRKLLAGKEEGT